MSIHCTLVLTIKTVDGARITIPIALLQKSPSLWRQYQYDNGGGNSMAPTGQ